MADYQEKPGQGVAFKNDNRPDNRHPNFKGEVLTPKGEALSIAIWDKVSKGGKPYFSILLSEPFKKTEKPVESAQPQKDYSRPYQPAPKPKPEDDGKLPWE